MVRAVGRGGTFPTVHGAALVPKGAKGRKHYLAGSLLGLAGTAPLAAGTVGLTERRTTASKSDRPKSLLREGLSGSGEALLSRGASLVEPVPARVRATQAGVAVGAGAAGSGLARAALRGRANVAKPIVAPIAGGLAAAASLPLSNKVVQRQSKDFVVTPTGVKRAKTPPKRPSAKANVVSARGGPFRAQVVPSDERFAKLDRDYLAQRGAVTAAGGVPGIGPFTQAAAAARYAPPGKQRQHAARQFGMGPVLGVAAGGAAAYGTARLGDRPKVAERALAFQQGRKKLTSRLRTSVGMAPEGKGLSHYSPRAGKALQAVKTSRAAKPFASPGRAAVAGAAFLGTKAVVGGVGGQAAISLNQRDQRRYKTGPTGVRKLDVGGRGQTRRDKQSLANKKRISAGLSAAGGVAGLTGLGLMVRGKKNPALWASSIGGGFGGANALINTPIQRKEAQMLAPVKKRRERAVHLAKGELEVRHKGDHSRVLGAYGDRGPLPKGLDRDEKMKAYEARWVKHGGPKAERWRTRAQAGETVQNAGLGVATLGGAAYLAAQTKRGGRVAAKLAPHRRKLDNIAIGGATAGGLGTIGAGYAHRKQSSYANSPGGVAASALRRMRDYTPEP